MISVRRLLIAVSTVTPLLLTPATALGATASPSVAAAQESCPIGTESQPFAPWGDESEYQLAPDGNFSTPAWTLAGGAARTSTGGPLSALGPWSVSLPPGGSVTSAAMCLDASEPTMRFFTAGAGNVLVQIVSRGIPIPVGWATAAGGWQPSPVMTTGAPVLGSLSGGAAQVSIRFTGLSGDPRIADVFIDPWNRG
jgi:hypothetical protein